MKSYESCIWVILNESQKISLILSHTVPNMPIKITLKTSLFSDFYFSTICMFQKLGDFVVDDADFVVDDR